MELHRLDCFKQLCNSVCASGSPPLWHGGGSAAVYITKPVIAGQKQLVQFSPAS
jgi:hypothetical protein